MDQFGQWVREHILGPKAFADPTKNHLSPEVYRGISTRSDLVEKIYLSITTLGEDSTDLTDTVSRHSEDALKKIIAEELSRVVIPRESSPEALDIDVPPASWYEALFDLGVGILTGTLRLIVRRLASRSSTIVVDTKDEGEIIREVSQSVLTRLRTGR